MGRSVQKFIDDFFLKHNDGDGEFVRGERGAPYTVIGPTHSTGSVIYTTKPQTALRSLRGAAVPPNLALIGRGGLPDKSELNWIADIIGMRTLVFLGDLDPVDLMIFAWLRECLPSKNLSYGGIGDSLLKRLQLSLNEAHILSCSLSENEAAPQLQSIMPDLEQNVGSNCAALLSQGRKIELEAIVSVAVDSDLLLNL